MTGRALKCRRLRGARAFRTAERRRTTIIELKRGDRGGNLVEEIKCDKIIRAGMSRARLKRVCPKEQARNNFPISRRALAPVWMTQPGASALRLIAACFTSRVPFWFPPLGGEG